VPETPDAHAALSEHMAALSRDLSRDGLPSNVSLSQGGTGSERGAGDRFAAPRSPAPSYRGQPEPGPSKPLPSPVATAGGRLLDVRL